MMEDDLVDDRRLPQTQRQRKGSQGKGKERVEKGEESVIKMKDDLEDNGR